MYDEDRLKQSKKDALEDCLRDLENEFFIYTGKKLYTNEAFQKQ